MFGHMTWSTFIGQLCVELSSEPNKTEQNYELSLSYIYFYDLCCIGNNDSFSEIEIQLIIDANKKMLPNSYEEIRLPKTI